VPPSHFPSGWSYLKLCFLLCCKFRRRRSVPPPNFPIGWFPLKLCFVLCCRTECTKLLVAISILTSTSDSERADTINRWIQVAVDTKTALGNLFGFCSIMLGLCLPQVSRNAIN